MFFRPRRVSVKRQEFFWLPETCSGGVTYPSYTLVCDITLKYSLQSMLRLHTAKKRDFCVRFVRLGGGPLGLFW